MIELLITITVVLMILVVGNIIGVVKLRDNLRRHDETEIVPADN